MAALCRDRGYPVLRIDGGVTANKRTKLVDALNSLIYSSSL
eukprot:SAG31_NODE_21067_length_558_cov_1.287582_2_plen_40_part_01